jgi:hypothetical protein
LTWALIAMPRAIYDDGQPTVHNVLTLAANTLY